MTPMRAAGLVVAIDDEFALEWEGSGVLTVPCRRQRLVAAAGMQQQK